MIASDNLLVRFLKMSCLVLVWFTKNANIKYKHAVRLKIIYSKFRTSPFSPRLFEIVYSLADSLPATFAAFSAPSLADFFLHLFSDIKRVQYRTGSSSLGYEPFCRAVVTQLFSDTVYCIAGTV